MDELDDLKLVFFEECAELLLEVESTTGQLAGGSGSEADLNALFRAVHSLKGGAGAFGFSRLVRFAHAYENILHALRSGELSQFDAIKDQALASVDVLSDLVGAAKGTRADPPPGEEVLVQQMEAAMRRESGAPAPAGAVAAAEEEFEFPVIPMADSGFGEDDFPVIPMAFGPAEAPGFQIDFALGEAAFLRGCEPRLVFRELREMGPLEVHADTSSLASLDDLASYDPVKPIVPWRLTLHTEVSAEKVLEAFQFIEGDCTVSIVPLAQVNSPPAEQFTINLAPAEPAHPPLEEWAVPKADAIITKLNEELAAAQSSPVPEAKKTVVEGALKETGDAQAASQNRTAGSVRVDVDKVDRLVDMVGELVIAHSMTHQQLSTVLEGKDLRAMQAMETLAQHMRALQEVVMAIRAQAVKTVFSRMGRVVRDLCSKTGKRVRLVTEGDEVEIDKSVLELLVDPLTHMIRNAIDHGIEPVEARLAAGKPQEGTIVLRALQRAGRLVVEIADDGAGINREKVLRKAVSLGLVSPDVNLSDDEIDRLVFRPGFSTADTVSDLSGRGVGMDVVLQNIQRLGGNASIRSVPGEGATIFLTLPLTLAVMDAMVVKVADSRYVVPLASIVETLSPLPHQIRALPGGARVLTLRNNHISLVSVAEALGLEPTSKPDRLLVMVVELEDGSLAALELDEVLGQQQVVVKNLDGAFGRPASFSSATILGDGKVALILDVSDICRSRRGGGSERMGAAA